MNARGPGYVKHLSLAPLSPLSKTPSREKIHQKIFSGIWSKNWLYPEGLHNIHATPNRMRRALISRARRCTNTQAPDLEDVFSRSLRGRARELVLVCLCSFTSRAARVERYLVYQFGCMRHATLSYTARCVSDVVYIDRASRSLQQDVGRRVSRDLCGAHHTACSAARSAA